MKRRDFIKTSAMASATVGFGSLACTPTEKKGSESDGQKLVSTETIFKISLAEWSLHKAIFGDKMKNIDFPAKARTLGIGAVEYVNTCFFDKAKDMAYLAELKNRCNGEGVKSLLIMCDREGAIGDADTDKRKKAVEAHYKWVEAAAYLGCHSIRVNAQSSGSYLEQQQRAAEGLRMLAEFADGHNIDVIVENHGGYSSSGKWLSEVMKQADHPRVGTLPDFGNFKINDNETYDRYLGVKELMPFAKAVSAKSRNFTSDGNEESTDYLKMMKIVLDAGYRGYVGIEFEGKDVAEDEGIILTKKLLERVRVELQPQYS